MEKIGASMRGCYRDRLTGPDGRLLYDSGWVTNTIVDNCRVLLAALMNNEGLAGLGGIQCLAVGRGNDSWDINGAPEPNEQIDNLEARYEPDIPVADLDIAYLDASDGPVPEGKWTSRLQITATLPEGYPEPEGELKAYPLREFGLFGGSEEQEYMINCVRHPVIHKHETATLERKIRLYF